MRAVVEAPEQPTPNPPRLEPELLRHFQIVATSTGGVARLRQLILSLAVRGRLVPQDASDEPASVLLESVQAERERIAASGGGRIRKGLAQTTPADAPFPLPSGWTWSVLPDLCAIAGGSTPPKSVASYWSGDIPWVSPKDMKVAQISDAQDHVSPAALKGGLSLIPPGSLLMVVRGMILAHSFPVAVTKVPVAINQDMKALTPYEPSLLPYLMLVCIGMKPEILGLVERSTHGTCKLESPKVFALPIPIPPLAEQARIVARVDELMRLCDSLEATGRLEAEQHARLLNTLLSTLTESAALGELAGNWQRVAEHFDQLIDRPEAVDALEHIFLQLAVRGLLLPQNPRDEPASQALSRIRREKEQTLSERHLRREKPVGPTPIQDRAFELPNGWVWVRLGELVLGSEAGWSPTCHATARRRGKWGVLKVSAVSWGAFDPDANKELPDGLQAREEYEVKRGDFLLSRANTAELVARSVVVADAPGQLMLSDKIIRLNVSQHVCREFLNLSNNADHTRAYYASNASGTSSSMKNVSRDVVLASPVALPPVAEQHRIVARVSEFRRLLVELRRHIVSKQSAQCRLADALVEVAAHQVADSFEGRPL